MKLRTCPMVYTPPLALTVEKRQSFFLILESYSSWHDDFARTMKLSRGQTRTSVFVSHFRIPSSPTFSSLLPLVESKNILLAISQTLFSFFFVFLPILNITCSFLRFFLPFFSIFYSLENKLMGR